MSLFAPVRMPAKAFGRFLLLFTQCFIVIALAVLTMVLMREAMYWLLVPGHVPAELIQTDDVWRMRELGIRFDARSAAILAIPLVLIALTLGLFRKTWKAAVTAFEVWTLAGFFIIIVLGFVNYFYIKTFHNEIDIFILNFLHEEPSAVMTTVWQDYPLVRAVLLALALVALLYWISLKGFAALARARIWDSVGWLTATAWVAAGAVFFVFLARGSLVTRYPLRRNNAQVSVLSQINNLVLNAPMSLHYAIQDRKHSMRFEPASLEQGQALMQAAGIGPLSETTPVNEKLAALKPNVVFFIMESMGYNMMSYDEAGKVDLMGALRRHFETDYVFHRFTSADLHTIQSVSQLLFLSPVSQISTSSIRHTALPGTPFEVYKKAGYRTAFVTSGTTAWENMSDYLPIQHVDDVYDQTNLMDAFGLTETSEWGVPDHYAFEFAAKLLRESTEPLFVVVLSTTNHPPYHVPEGYKPKPITVPEAINANYNHHDVDQDIRTIMATYQYSADALGRAISAIKADTRHETVIAATADHRMLGMKPIVTDGPFKDLAVPFYVWASQGIQKAVDIRYDPMRIGSHKDIFPTLYALSLSQASYRTVGGRNMLAPQDDPRRAFGYNISLWIDEDGAYTFGEHMRRYPWSNESTDWITQYNQPQQVDPEKKQRINAYRPLDLWQLNERACGTRP